MNQSKSHGSETSIIRFRRKIIELEQETDVQRQTLMDSRKSLDKGYIQLYPVRSPRSLRKDVVCTSQIHTPKRERVQTSRTKFSLRGRDCNIPGIGVKKNRGNRCVHCIHA